MRISCRNARRACLLAPAAMALAAISIATPAAAQETPPAGETAAAEEGDTITVLGRRLRDSIANGYVRELGTAETDNPLSRYAAKSYCPAVIGLSEELVGRIETRMRLVAEAAGVEPAAPGCIANALVLLVDGKDAFLADFRDQYPNYFATERGERREPEPGPAEAWQLVRNVDYYGRVVARGEANYAPGGASRVLAPIRAEIVMAVVVIEREALIGLSPVQIADYALMRSLTQARPADLEGSGAPTVLTVVTAPDGAEVPASLTEWDLAYVEARYSGDPRRYGDNQGSAIRKAVREAASERAPDAPEG